MFLATVGVNAGQPFVRTVAESGLTMLFIGVASLLTTLLIVLLVGHYLLKIPYDDLVDVTSGATGNPAILVYSTKMAPTDPPDDLSVDDIGEGNRGADRRLARVSRSGSAACGGHAAGVDKVRQRLRNFSHGLRRSRHCRVNSI
jgi:hypothetical protein